MKRFILSLFISLTGFFSAFGMSFSEAQEHAYYLTDKMAYELDLTPEQYDQVYQVNLEYLLNVRSSNPFNYYWDYRNTDLSYILFDWQYRLYRATDYFFRPVVRRHRAWYFPLWEHYHRTYYYYSRPTIYTTWHGGIWVGRTHHTPSPYYGHRPATHIGGMAGHGGHYNHGVGGGHPVNHGNNGGYNHNNGGNHNHNGGARPGNNGGARPGNNGGARPGNNGYNHNNNGGYNHNNNGGDRPGNNGGVNSGNRGGSRNNGGSRGGSATPSRGGSSSTTTTRTTTTTTRTSTPTRTNSSATSRTTSRTSSSISTRTSSTAPTRTNSSSATSGSRGGTNSAGSRSFGGGRR